MRYWYRLELLLLLRRLSLQIWLLLLLLLLLVVVMHLCRLARRNALIRGCRRGGRGCIIHRSIWTRLAVRIR